jgi:hypothetical protein
MDAPDDSATKTQKSTRQHVSLTDIFFYTHPPILLSKWQSNYCLINQISWPHDL